MIVAILFSAHLAHAVEPEYKRATPDCASCAKFEKLLERADTELSPDERLRIALDVANVIRGLSIKSKPPLNQRREIYFAINSTIQVLPDDFDAETVVRLLDLRAQAPAVFDDVLWHFQVGEQKKIVERMRAFKDDKIRPNATIPLVKDLN